VHLNFSEILYIFVLGVILYVVLKRQLFDPIGKILQDREDTVEGSKVFVAEAEKKIEKYKSNLDETFSETSSNAYEIQDKARHEGYDKRKEFVSKAQDEAYKMLTGAREEISRKSKDVFKQLEKDADIYAHEIASAFIGRRVK